MYGGNILIVLLLVCGIVALVLGKMFGDRLGSWGMPCCIAIVAAGLLVGILIANKVDPGWYRKEEPCENCGTLFAEDASFCPACGESRKSLCNICNEPIEEGANFCIKCGAEVKE